MTGTAERRLLLSIHDVGPRFESEVDRLRDLLGRHAPADRISLLVVPNHWGQAPIRATSAFARRLHRWADSGADIFVHGWYHRDEVSHPSALARFRAQHMTAGEGEFLGLSRSIAAARMQCGRALLEDITGRPVAGFVAPAWLYGAGAMKALADCGFTMAEDHLRVWNPATGDILCRSPVLTWASRSPARIASSRLAAGPLPILLRHMPTARMAVHPGDVGVPALVASIDRAAARLSLSHRPSRYSDLQVAA
jgi:predicted deacetylase